MAHVPRHPGPGRASQSRTRPRRCRRLLASEDPATTSLPALPPGLSDLVPGRAGTRDALRADGLDLRRWWTDLRQHGAASGIRTPRQVRDQWFGSARSHRRRTSRKTGRLVGTRRVSTYSRPAGHPRARRITQRRQRGKGAWLRPATFPLRPEQIVFAIDTKAPTLTHSPLAAAGRYIITADVKPAGSRIIRTHVSLPDAIPMPTEQYVYRLHGTARLLLTDPGPQDGVQWAVRADGVIQLSGIDAERTGLWRPGVALPTPVRRVSTAPIPAPHPVTAPITDNSSRPSSTESPGVAPAAVDPKAVVRVRKALYDFAKRRTPTAWSTLGSVAQVNLTRLSPIGRRDLLIAADHPPTPNKPVLSALVREASGHPLSDMPSTIRKLGLARFPPTTSL